MSLAEIANFISKKTGIDSKIIGESKIAKVVENRRSACGLADIKTYLQVLQTSQEEFTELVEKIVVPETYFFRDRKSFDFLIQFVRSQWLAKSSQSTFRLLSVPCSTGEEPFSIAITLMEAGLSPAQYRIDAIDISKHAIAKAQRGIYGKNSFRGEEFVDRNRYFQQTSEGYKISLPLRNVVNFRQGNIIDTFSDVQAKYDIIFCRNLLIYLESSACTQVLNTLNHLLLPRGLLFVGSAETGKIKSELFTSMRQPFTVYRKINSTQSLQTLANISTPIELTKNNPLPVGKLPKQTEKLPTLAQKNPCPAIISSAICQSSLEVKELAISETSSNLEIARQLADAGHLEAAINHCNKYLECVSSTNGQAYTLLGTLYQAQTKYVQAEQYFRKALYLNPNDYEALIHLALLKEHRGDVIGASILQKRIQKLQQTS